MLLNYKRITNKIIMIALISHPDKFHPPKTILRAYL